MPITASTPFVNYSIVRQLDRIEKKLDKLLSKRKEESNNN